MKVRRTSVKVIKCRPSRRRSGVIARPVAPPSEPASEDDDELPLEALEIEFAATFSNARQLIARTVLTEEIPSEVRYALRRNSPVVVLIDTPTPSWAAAVSAAIPSMFPGVAVVSAAKAPGRNFEPDIPSPTKPIVAISSNRSWLSPVVVAGADFAVRLRISAEAVGTAIARYYSVESCSLSAGDFAGLDLQDLAFAMRPKTTLDQCVARIRRAVQSMSNASPLDSTPKLSDLVGFGEAMRSLEVIAADFVRRRDSGADITLPNLLLYGPPGTGKTTLAKAFARSVNAPLIQTSVADWFTSTNGHLGDVASAAQRFFDRAIALAPSIAFIDELDAIPSRDTMDDKDRSWWTPIVTGVLVQIDGLRNSRRGVVLIAATNHKSKLDSALVRPGRFDRHIEILGPQTSAEVEAVFRQCLDGDLADVAITPAVRIAGKPTGASIEAWVRQSREEAKREGRAMTVQDVVAAIAPRDTRSPRQIESVALHEAAHAVVAAALGLNVMSATIVDTETSGGMTELGSDGAIFSRLDLEHRAIAMLAGRACDELFSQGATSGAASDLWKATALVMDIHSRLGLGDSLLSAESFTTDRLPMMPALHSRVEADLDRLMEQTRLLVEECERPIRALAAQLVAQRAVTAADIAAVMTSEFDASSITDPGET